MLYFEVITRCLNNALIYRILSARIGVEPTSPIDSAPHVGPFHRPELMEILAELAS
ncbi:hypothetical protein [Saccharopolyspora hattusasensis]|uniref:hypothetical protein n=1 Tax=Saccharopolyspora hattusasensis TaxID=1128679 RepID=UPI003D99127C